jgi:drug/metabolite transporter (DMT)-like permease
MPTPKRRGTTRTEWLICHALPTLAGASGLEDKDGALRDRVRRRAGTMSSFHMPTPTADEVRRGIVYMIASVFIFALANAAVKWLVTDYPVTEIVFVRCLFALLPCGVLVATHGGLSVLRTRRIKDHALRACSQFLAMVSIFTAFRLMPLADAVAIQFASPLFLTVLSIFLLGEQVGLHRWSAVLVGFAGVLVMVQPGPGLLESGAGFALVNAVVSASVTIAMRRMSLTESSTALVAWQGGFTLLLSLCLLPFGWVTPSWQGLLLMAAVGILSGIGQFCWTQAFRFAPAAVAAPFSYMSMIWALGFGYILWGDVPTVSLLAGGAVVAASGLYILYRETVRRRGAGTVAPVQVGSAHPGGILKPS